LVQSAAHLTAGGTFQPAGRFIWEFPSMKAVLTAGVVILTTIGASPISAAPNHAPEISSAATRSKQAKPKQRRQAQPARAPRAAPFRWRPADPSFDQQGRPYRPPPGLSCPIDLGYGRWASCNDDF
jgi:hypothetical protein